MLKTESLDWKELKLSATQMQRNRIGAFKVTKELLLAKPWEYQLFFREIVILSLAAQPGDGTMLYYGWAPWFDGVKLGEKVPLYTCEITDGAIVIWKRTEEYV